MILCLINLIRPGLYNIFLTNLNDYLVDLENFTAITIRNFDSIYNFTARRGNNQQLSHHLIKPSVKYFSISDSPLILSTENNQSLTQWIIPSNLCRNHNYIHNFSFKYFYNIESSKFTTSCLFFSNFNSKHFISINSNNRNHTFTAQFYTSSSLNRDTSSKICNKTTSCYISMIEPFFIKLSLQNNKYFNLSIEMITSNFLNYNQNCNSEIINELEEAKYSNIMKWDKIFNQKCEKPFELFFYKLNLIFQTFLILLFILLILHCFDFINCYSLFGFNSEEQRFFELKDNPIANQVENPIYIQ